MPRFGRRRHRLPWRIHKSPRAFELQSALHGTGQDYGPMNSLYLRQLHASAAAVDRMQQL